MEKTSVSLYLGLCLCSIENAKKKGEKGRGVGRNTKEKGWVGILRKSEGSAKIFLNKFFLNFSQLT